MQKQSKMAPAFSSGAGVFAHLAPFAPGPLFLVDVVDVVDVVVAVVVVVVVTFCAERKGRPHRRPVWRRAYLSIC